MLGIGGQHLGVRDGTTNSEASQTKQLNVGIICVVALVSGEIEWLAVICNLVLRRSVFL